ncbi:hypothetical protein CAP31_09610 [Sulfuriferula sp. AH1]|uniref:sterol desaturase family protein n=1 Tax=Sulfuriferula sp. AH1 TaxID=1985873 RepID=UPI000B3B1152|nr:sterol desaturase family protein [Sulfuriferula sp. AH1]ARU31909.1 hypothetical protein CAP31_09610 [Sulfuriferula sp. AH1]
MNLFNLEFSKTAYFADFAVYLLLPAVAAFMLLHYAPQGEWINIVIAGMTGLVAWTLLEYVLHRFVLHGIEPFKGWHTQHHLRPYALIGTPTVFSLMLFLVCIFLPALLVEGIWSGGGFTLGVVSGYAVYSWMHHAAHHWRANGGWLKRRKRLHAMHHHGQSKCDFGVITSFWDRVFGTHVD